MKFPLLCQSRTLQNSKIFFVKDKQVEKVFFFFNFFFIKLSICNKGIAQIASDCFHDAMCLLCTRNNTINIKDTHAMRNQFAIIETWKHVGDY